MHSIISLCVSLCNNWQTAWKYRQKIETERIHYEVPLQNFAEEDRAAQQYKYYGVAISVQLCIYRHSRVERLNILLKSQCKTMANDEQLKKINAFQHISLTSHRVSFFFFQGDFLFHKYTYACIYYC